MRRGAVSLCLLVIAGASAPRVLAENRCAERTLAIVDGPLTTRDEAIRLAERLGRLRYTPSEVVDLIGYRRCTKSHLAQAVEKQGALENLELLVPVLGNNPQAKKALDGLLETVRKHIEDEKRQAASCANNLDRVVQRVCSAETAAEPPVMPPPRTQPPSQPRSAGYADLVKVVLGEATDEIKRQPEGVFTGKNSWPNTYSIKERRIEYNGPPLHGVYTWSEIPKTVGRDGFDVDVTVEARSDDDKNGFSTGIGVQVDRATTQPSPAMFDLKFTPGGQSRAGGRVHVTPATSLDRGQEFSISIGAYWGAGVTYTYRVR